MSSPIKNLAHQFLILIFLTTGAIGATNGASKADLDNQGRPLWEPGVLWVKVNPSVVFDRNQREINSFNESSLDGKMTAFGIKRIIRAFQPKERLERSDLPDLTRIFTLELPPNANEDWVAKALALDSNVEYAERVPRVYPEAIPNDEFYASIMYHLPQIQAEQAWDLHKGEDGAEVIIVGISDSGVDWKHPDLAANIYNRLGEDADGDSVTMVWDSTEWVMDPDDLNGIDDDENGYVDDLIGWNFMLNPQGTQNNDPMDPPNRGHGSHVAGLAAGVTDNSIGIASISWNVKILPTSHSYTEDGGHYMFRAYSGLIYLADNGAHIINASWGGGGYSQAAEEVIRYINGVGALFVSSAGNEDDGEGGMVGFGDRYPTSYPGCVSVASVDRFDNKAWYSSFGWGVDISAPGGNHAPGLLSTVPYGDGYDSYSGTSMAGPVAAGMFALVKSFHPDWTNDQIINQVIGTTDDISSMNQVYENWLGSGRINAFKALDEEDVSVPNAFRLALKEVIHSNPAAEDWNMSPGDITDIRFTFRNYAHILADSSVSFTLSSDDPHLLISNSSMQDTIFADDYFTTDEFSIQISEGANTQVANLWLAIEPQNAEVLTGDTVGFDLIVNSTSLSSSYLDLELNSGDIDTSMITISNSAELPVTLTTSATSIDPSSLLWHVSEFQSYAGTSWWCGDPDLGGYPDATVQYLSLPALDLTSSNNPVFSFMLDWDIEDPGGADAPFDGWDGANVWISTDRGENFEVIEPVSPAYTCSALSAWGDYWEIGLVPGWAGSHSEGFVEAQFDLSAYVDQEVVIRLGFASDGAATGEGVFVDNILVQDGNQILFENDGAFEGGMQVSGFPFEMMPTPWVMFPDGGVEVPGNGTTELEIVTNTTNLSPGFYSTTANVLHAGHIMADIDINLSVIDPSSTEGGAHLPKAFLLKQNYPNPFNPSTTISYALPMSIDVNIQVFDIQGRLVANPVVAYQSAGYYDINWIPRDLNGAPLSTGLYFTRIQAGDFHKVIRMIYLK